jgi:hypothetical protein
MELAPDAKVNVYLSSSMATPEHQKLRDDLKEYLDKHDLLNVYAIETLGSGFGPEDLMPQKILWSDVVLMFLEDGLRPGVVDEYYLAQRNGRRLIMLKHLGARSQELQDFIDRVEEEGCVFVGKYRSIEDLKAVAQQSLRADVANVYREARREPSAVLSQVTHIIPSEANEACAFLREEFVRAGNSNSSKRAGEEQATRTLMKAFLDGSDSVPEAALQLVLNTMPREHEDTVRLRWQAIQSAFGGDYGEAIHHLEGAKAEAKSKNLPMWVIHDIVRDIQYMEICQVNLGGDLAMDRLKSLRHMPKSLTGWEARSPVYFDLYGLTHRFFEETVDFELLGNRTLIVGSSLPEHLDKTSEVLVTAIWLGSYNMLRTTRSLIAQLLIHYGLQHDEKDLLVEGVKQLALGADLARLEKFLKTHSTSIASLAYESLLGPGVVPGLELALPERRRARCLLIEHFGDYIVDDDLDSVVSFLKECYDYDVEKGFHGTVMHQALGAISVLAARMDPQWVYERAFPLLSVHPLLADRAEAALLHSELHLLDEKDLLKIADTLLAHRSEPQLSSRLNLLVELSKVSARCRTSISEALIGDWQAKANPVSIGYYIYGGADPDRQLASQMAKAMSAAIDSANRSLSSASPLGFGGLSGWELLSGLLKIGAEVDNEELASLAVRVLCNVNQSSNEKRDCMWALLWHASCGGIEVLNSVSSCLTGREKEVLSVRGRELPLFQAIRLELGLFLTAVQAAAQPVTWPSFIQVQMRGSASASEDARLATARILRLVESMEPTEHHDTATGLLGVLTRDDAPAVRIMALHGLSERTKLVEEFQDMLADRTTALSQDEHPAVREAAAYVAGAWREEDWAHLILQTLAQDASHSVRQTAAACMHQTRSSGKAPS